MDDDPTGIFTNFKKISEEVALFDAIERKDHKRFRSFISEPGFDIDQVDKYGRSILMQLATIPHGFKFVQQLLHKGANVHLKDNSGNSFLHLAIRARTANNLKMGELVIGHGADINGQDNSGLTPIYTACLEGNAKWIHMLLYYGADPNIASKSGLLPMAVLSPRLRNDYDSVLEILFHYANSEITLPTLAAAMWKDTSLFSKICQISPQITYDLDDVKYFCNYFSDSKSKHFQIFMQKFDHVLDDIMEKVDLLQVVVEAITSMDFPENWNIFNFFLDSKYLPKLVHNTDPSTGYISDIIKGFADYKRELHSRIFLLLSYGLGVILQDLQTVFDHYGNGALFRTMLHLDVAPISKEISSIVRLCYDPKLTLEDCGTEPLLLHYFNSPKLKERCLEIAEEGVVETVREMPNVCSLVELSRNVVRKYIVQRYQITRCKDFYTVLNGLPIDRITKGIIALERKIY